ncbi:hypothetical protein ACTQYZ_09535 [Anaerofustis sp. LCP19S3_F7]|uniref:hypothetical protein n=1 Tax=Anaerofustis sp. LCP19S3_F7 TaxID=3440247 RepID=UPI003F8EA46C
MKKLKGCFNKECKAFFRKDKFKEDYEYCPMCGQKLSYVCTEKQCYNLLENPLAGICEDCIKKKEEQKEKRKETAQNVVDMGSKAVEKVAENAPQIVAAVGIGKKAINIIAKKK